MTALALLFAGFSLFSALVLALTHFRSANYQGLEQSRLMGLLLLLALSDLQLAHFVWLYSDMDWINTPAYRIALFVVAPAFLLFSRPLLQPVAGRLGWVTVGVHALPAMIAPCLSQMLALPLAFLVGAAYLIWLARSLYALRRERVAYGREMLLLGGVFCVAVGMSALGLAQAWLPGKLFFSLYTLAIGLAFLLVQVTLGMRPQLSGEVRDTVQAYATSTLGNVDCDGALRRLDTLMGSGRAYGDADLSLAGLAEQLGLRPHQLSELLNVRLGKSFSRYLREHRVAAAKTMLRDEPSASVLSVGLSVGFSSQSTFYEAFREIEGMTPGQYCRLGRGLGT